MAVVALFLHALSTMISRVFPFHFPSLTEKTTCSRLPTPSRASGSLPTYDVVGIRTTSYLPDIAYDIVGQDLRCRMCTTSYVMTYDIDRRHRTCPTYDVETYDVHTISSKRTMSYVTTTISYGIHRMRNRRLNQLHRMRHRIRCLQCFAPAAARGIRIRIAVFALAI